MKALIFAMLGVGLFGHTALVSADQPVQIVASYEPAIGEKKLDLGTYTHPAFIS